MIEFQIIFSSWAELSVLSYLRYNFFLTLDNLYIGKDIEKALILEKHLARKGVQKPNKEWIC